MKAHKILNILVLFSLAFIIVGLFTFAHVCGGMGDMKPKCVTTKNLTIVVSVILIVLSFIQISIKNTAIQTVLSIVQFISGIVIILLPIVIAPVCKMKTMHCYAYTRPLLVIMGIVIVGIVFIDFLISLKGSRGEKNGQIS